MKIEVTEELRRLADAASFPVYITGGFVRNKICGLGSTDIDICGPVVATALNLPKNYYIKTVNFRLGTSVIKCGNESYEYTPFRTENYSAGGGHVPASIGFTTDIKADALRRDFACNALYYDIKKDELIDLTGGLADCQNKILRAVSEKTFLSDGLRLMRLARIAAETGFKIESKTANAALNNAHLLKDISAERIRDELNRILCADKKYGVENAHYRGLKLLIKLSLMKYILPELLEGDGLKQNEKYHKYDVLEHTLQTVRFAEPSVRLAALFHDIAKPYCFKKYGKMHGHERVSELMAKEMLGQRGLKYSNDVVDETAALCGLHMYDLDKNTSENKMRLFIAKNHDIIDKLILLNDADRLGSGLRGDDPSTQSRFGEIKAKMIEEGAPFCQSSLKINGTDLVAMGFNGPAIGEVLDDMFTKCVVEPRLNNEEWLKEHAQRYLERINAKENASI